MTAMKTTAQSDGLDFHTLQAVIKQQLYAIEYQPLIDLASGKVFAYEALARFYAPDGGAIPPDILFQSLHRDPLTLFQVETRMKELQIRHAPAQTLFLNIDPHAFGDFDFPVAEHPMLQLLGLRDRVVVEIIENSDISEARASLEMERVLRSHGIKLALDDIGAPDAMLSLCVLARVDYMKLDRSWLLRCRERSQRLLLDSLLGYARESGKLTVLEGIETTRDLDLAQDLGIDYAQGYLYREQFLRIDCRQDAKGAWPASSDSAS